MGDPFDVIAQRMRPIVHRINAPFVAGVMVRRVPNAIKHRIAQPDVRRAHVDLRPQRARAIREFARFHSRKQVEIFLDRPIAKRTFLSEAAIFVRFLRRHVVNVGLAFAHELDCVFVEFVEIIRRVERRAAEVLVGPAVDQPMHVGHDRIDVFGFLLCRVGVVHANVADAAELVRDSEVEADRFRVADVQITVRLGRKTGADLFVFSRANILRDDVANKVRRCGSFSASL